MIDALIWCVLLAIGAAMAIAIPVPGYEQTRSCAPGWDLVEGVRRREGDVIGEFTCERSPPQGCGESTGRRTQPCPTMPRYKSRIYCTGGSLPIVVDYRTVGCQR